MKKLLSILFSTALLLCLTGCSSEVEKIDSEISKLGNITLDSYETLEDINQRFDSLEDEEKQRVKGLTDLQNANKRMNELLYAELIKSIDTATDLEESWFAQSYNMQNFTKAKDAAQTAVDKSDTENYFNSLESLKSEIDSFSAYIESEKNNSFSVQTNTDEHPFAVDASNITFAVTAHPFTKRSSEYPKYVSFWSAETTDSLSEFTLWVGNETCHYSYEPIEIETKGIEVQDENGELQTAYVNTELVLHDTQIYSSAKNGLYPLGKESCYIFENKEHGLTIAVKDSISGKGYIPYAFY
jgi:hypothetical protein